MRSLRAASVVAFALLVVGVVYAAGTPQPITGIVRDASGNPAPQIPCRLFLIVDPGTDSVGGEQPRGGGGKRSTDLQHDTLNLAGKGGVPKGAVATDANGKFEFKPQAPGNYRILAGTNPKTTGMANVYFSVSEGSPANVEIKLEIRK